MIDAPIVKWAGRLLCVLLWLGLGCAFASATWVGPGLTPMFRVALGCFLALVWGSMGAAIGPVMWYVTEPLPKRH